MQMVEKYLWTMHGCKPLPPTEEECRLERQRLVGHRPIRFCLPCRLMTIPASSVTLYPYASVYRGSLSRHPPATRPMHGPVVLLHKQEAAKEERKRKAATAKLAKEAQQAQQALQQMPGLQPPANPCIIPNPSYCKHAA